MERLACCWVATLLVTGLVRAAQEAPPLLLEYGAVSWVGPAAGCAGADGVGRLEVACALPAGRVLLSLDRSANALALRCEDGAYKCSEIAEAASYFAGYVDLWNATMKSLTVSNCSLEESLLCVLATVNATDTEMLKLEDPRGALLPRHVDGLTALAKLRIHGAEHNISEVPYEALAVLPRLTSFTLMGGALRLHGESETRIPELTKLELSQGALRELPARAFAATPALTTLMVWGNKIDSIDEEAFAGLSQLESLILNNNELSTLPARMLRDCTALRLLHAFGNQLVEFPAELLVNLSRLEEVKIFRNRASLRLESRTFAELPALKSVWLDNCDLRDLPEDLFLNTPLQKLSMSGNNLTDLPSKILSSVKLLDLVLAGNQLKELPAELLSDQSLLERLDLSSNKLSRIQGGLFAALNKLTYLSLRNNRLELIERTSLSGLAALRELDLSQNRLAALDAAAFDALPALQVLLASDNSLQLSALAQTFSYSVEGAADGQGACWSPFGALKELRRLDLRRNRLLALCDDWRVLLHLEKLDLAYNNISELTDVDLDFLSLARVDLRYNNITNIRPYLEVKKNSNKGATFLLDNNPYACDCNLYPFVLAYQENKSTYSNLKLSSAECASPSARAGRRVLTVEPSALTCAYTPCPPSCSCSFRASTSRLELQCAAVPSTPPSKDMTIDLTLTNMTNFSKLPFHVKYLNLSNLNLTEVPYVDAEEVDLRHNKLSSAPLHLIEANISVKMADNLLRCDCSSRDSLQLLQKYRRSILDYSNVTCADGRSVAELRTLELCLNRDAAIVSAALAVAFLVCMIVIVATYHVYKTEIRILLRKYGLWFGQEDLDDKKYDAFVSFAHQDEKFVFEKLVPSLESGRRPLRLCVHTRDWRVGDWIPAQIERSVEQSRRTVVVLSQHFVKSVWGQMEFRAAHARERVVVLVLDDAVPDKCTDPELAAYVSTNTYVRADDPLVWDRIRDAVLRKNKVATALDKLRAGGLNATLEDGKLVNGALSTPT